MLLAAAGGEAGASATDVLLAFVVANGHVVVEALLLATIVFLLLQRSYKPDKKPLTEREIDALCAEWQPVPLVPPLTAVQRASCSPPVLAGPTGARVTLASGVEAVNLVSFDFLGLASDRDVQAACAAAIQKYGVGSCGPRGFYGTIDVHLELEAALAAFMGTEEAMIFSYDVATPASTIPAFAKRGDLLVVDEGVSYALQAGVTLSRSEVRYFRHNDVADLERVLAEVAAEDKAARRPTSFNRRFIVVEGLYANYGDLAPLAAICELKRRHCFRLLVDESLAFGALPHGAGRGAAEHAGVPPGEAEIITSSLGNTLGAVGGFCAGSQQVISHQRLNASGYCFSASLPPYLAAGAVAALAALSAQPARRDALARNAAQLRAGVAKLRGVAPPAGEPCCPLVHLRLAQPPADAEAAEALLQRVCDAALADGGVLLTTAKYSVVERRRPPPSIRMAVSAAHSPADIEQALAALKAALAKEGVK